MSQSNVPPAAWSAILADAVNKPGVISEAYQRFWTYSVGNQLLALFQCQARGILPGPIHTFVGWRELGRHVKKGEKALTLCMPVRCRAKAKKGKVPPEPDEGEATSEEDRTYTRFVYRPHWFVLAQTEGQEYVPADLPDWSEAAAMAELKIVREEFRHPDGNAQGYAYGQVVSVSPVAAEPHRTLFHELGHVVLGHTEELGRLDDGPERTPLNLMEVEAECVALICCESLGLGGSEFSRGYVQHWLGAKKEIPDRSAQRIFKAADQVLRAGRRGENSAKDSSMS